MKTAPDILTSRLAGVGARAPFPHVAHAVLALLVACAFVAFLSGCKSTDVLTEHVEDPDLGELDVSASAIYEEDEDAPEDPLQSSNEVQDSERTDLQEELTPLYDETAEENGVAVQRVYDPDSPYDKAASEGTEYSETPDEELESEEVDEEQTEDDQSTSDEEEQAAEEEETQQQEEGGESESEEEGGFELTSGIGGTGTTYDATGSTAELPENCSKVAAAGSYATIVQMLAGYGGLVACDSYWQEQVAQLGLFPDEGVEDLATAWTSDASGTYTLDVKALIAAEPDAILVDGVDYKLTDAQAKKVQAASIDIITVPQLGESGTPDSYITDAVNLVGELLKNSTTVTYSTQASASTYVEMHDSVIDACKEANGGYSVKSIGGTTWSYIYQDDTGKGTGTVLASASGNRITTVYFDTWTSAASSTVIAKRSYSSATLEYLNGEDVDTSDGVGLSATVTNNSFALLDYYLQVSGVVNNAYDYMRPRTSDAGTSSPYVLIAGTSSDLVNASTKVTTRSIPSALWYTPTTIQLGTVWSTVGDADFPGVITSTEDIAQTIVASAGKTDGLYNVGQPYEVYVMPSGIDGSWACGTAESYLSCAWALKTFWDASGVDELAEEATTQFYTTFYRVDEDDVLSTVSCFETTYTAECPTE